MAVSKGISSSELPADFFAPATRKREHLLAKAVDRKLRYLSTATITFQRVIAISGGPCWILLLVVIFKQGDQRPEINFGPLWDDITYCAWVILFLSAIGVTAAGVIHRKSVYRIVLGFASITYVTLVITHALFILFLGLSPLSIMRLADFSVIPAALLVAAFPGRNSIYIAVFAVGLAAALNHNTPLSIKLILEIAYSVAPVVPFLVLVSKGLITTSMLDSFAARAHRDAAVIARQQALAQLEARFLAFIHDSVITHLSAIRHQTLPATADQLSELLSSSDKLTPSANIPLVDAITDIIKAVTSEYPLVRITAPDEIAEELEMPIDAAAALTDAMRQAAVNARVHTIDAEVELVLSMAIAEGNVSQVSALLRDHGAGFDTKKLPADRAGIRLSILGRLNQTLGCSGNVDSRLGQGTDVNAQWSRTLATKSTDKKAEPEGYIPSVYDSLGFGDIFRPIFVLPIWLLFFGLSTTNTHPRPILWLVSLILTLCVLIVLVQRRNDALPNSYAFSAVILIQGFYLVAALENISDEPTWPFSWYPASALLMSAFLALRTRPALGWLAWGGCLVMGAVLARLGFDSEILELSTSLLLSIALIPATLLLWLVKRISNGLPLLLAHRREQVAGTAVELTQNAYIAGSRDWLAQRIKVLLNHQRPLEERITAAHLMERRLRDSIRSPLLDIPPITAAIWDARIREVTVKLLDDRSNTEQPIPVESAGQLSSLIIETLEIAQPGDTVVVRLLPPGRASIATILHNAQKTGESSMVRI